MQTLLKSTQTAWSRGWAGLLRSLFTLLLGGAIALLPGTALPALATGIYEMPEAAPENHVLDIGEVFSRLTKGQITGELENLAKTQGQDVEFVTIRRLDYGETIDSFTQQLFDRWYSSPEAKQNQTLLVIDVLTNNTSIIQGEGAKAALDPTIATSVAQETVLVPLKQGNRYNQAFLDASSRITKVMSGQEDPGAPEIKETIQTDRNFATPEETQESNATTWVIVLLVLSTAIPMATWWFYQYMGNR
ncbi:MAG: hypothetical protein RLZZ511_2068 [Cyanobacteriota bacterium]|jgi:uncharacterized protein